MKKVIKILMLDCDGVLNSRQSLINGTCPLIKEPIEVRGFHSICPILKDKLFKILEIPNVYIILSSTWRLSQYMKQHLNMQGVYFIGETPRHNPGEGHQRHKQIQYWLDNTKFSKEFAGNLGHIIDNDIEIEDFIIIDDDSDANIEGHFYKTSYDTGITDDLINQIKDRWIIN